MPNAALGKWSTFYQNVAVWIERQVLEKHMEELVEDYQNQCDKEVW